MTERKEDHPVDLLAQTIFPGSKLLRSWPLAGGISAAMTAVEVKSPDGQVRRMIVRQPGETALKQNPHAAQDEFRLLQITRSLGLATPAPYYLDLSGQIISTPYLVIEYIEGQPHFARSYSAGFTSQLADHLARIHHADTSKLDLSFLPGPVHGCAEIAGKRPAQEDGSFEEGRIRDALESAWPLSSRNRPVLLHGDYWPGNILWRDDRLVAVIDWEDARIGDPLSDLAISRLDLLWIFGREAMEEFTHDYQSRLAIDTTGLPYWDLCAALRLVRLAGSDLPGWAAFFAPFGRQDITERSIREYVRFFTGQVFDKLQSQ